MMPTQVIALAADPRVPGEQSGVDLGWFASASGSNRGRIWCPLWTIGGALQAS
jgi:hypothetical protein